MGNRFRLAIAASVLGLLAQTAPVSRTPWSAAPIGPEAPVAPASAAAQPGGVDTRTVAAEAAEEPVDPPSTQERKERVQAVRPLRSNDNQGLSTQALSTAKPPKSHDPHTLVLRYAPGTTLAQRQDAAADAGGSVVESIPALHVDLVSTKGARRDDVASRLEADPRVDDVSLNTLAAATDLPNDDFIGVQSGLYNSRLPSAWDVTHSSTGLIIAIVDSGVDLNHPDLDGRLSDSSKWKDFANNDSNPQDDNGHGTNVAGIAAAETNNGRGVAGASWGAKIMPIKVLDSNAIGTTFDIAQGIVWAADKGARVINLSLAAGAHDPNLEAAVNYATSTKKATVVAAAGNSGTSDPMYPAAYDATIAVGATDEYGDLTSFSTRGPWVDVVAQGWNVASTDLSPGTTEEYISSQGTSMAAPIVAGVAALVLTKRPTFTPAQVLSTLRSKAIDRGPRGIDDGYGWGLVDAYGAVGGRTAAVPPPAKMDISLDDVFANARAVGGGTTGTISPEGDVDWFYVDTGGAGTITFNVTNDPSFGALDFDPIVRAYTPNAELLGTFDNAATASEVVSLNVGGAGRYRFEVRSKLSSRTFGPLSNPDPFSVTASFAPGAVSSTPGDVLWVTNVAPVPFSEDTSPSVSPLVVFGRAVTEASAENPNNVKLIDAKTGSGVSTTLSYDSGSRVVTIDPVAALSSGRTYVISVNGVSDGSGTMVEEFESRFRIDSPDKAVKLTSDFNKDGFEDTVIAAPGQSVNGKAGAGVVHVLYGTASGPTGSSSHTWHQNVSGVHDQADSGDHFGAAVATGDVNNDGYDDLLIGVPDEDLNGKKNSGGVHLLMGSASKLRSAKAQFWTQDTSNVPGVMESFDRFGAALAVGDFNSPKGDDVAIGSPGEAIGSVKSAGSLHILSGASGGLTSVGAQVFTQNSPGIDFFVEAGDKFGASIAAGDLNGDTHDDLLVGAPSDNVADVDTNEGSVTVMRGSFVGVRPVTILFDAFDPSELEDGDAFGAAVAIADLGGYFTTDGYAELVIGIPGESSGVTNKNGRAFVLYTDHSDLYITSQSIDQGSFGLGAAETNAQFGFSLAARTFGTVGSLAIGAPFDGVSGQSQAGSAQAYMSDGTLVGGYMTLVGSVALSQDRPGVQDAAEPNDRFAWDVGLLDTDGDDFADLLVGSPYETVSGDSAAGIAHAFRDVDGSALPSAFSQNTSGVSGSPDPNDLFGAAIP